MIGFKRVACLSLSMYKLKTLVYVPSIMSNNTTPVTAWASGTNRSWERLQAGFKNLSVEFAALSDKSTQAVRMPSA